MERLLTLVLTGCAIVIATSVAYRTFVQGTGRSGEVVPPKYVDGWESTLEIGLPIGGASTAPIKLIMFSDLQCPACRGFHSTLAGLLKERSNDVQAVFVHYPLPYHEFASPAARAAECANAMGAFRPWIDIVYAKQDSLGFLQWSELAERADIDDAQRIQDCAVDTVSVANIDKGGALAKSLGANGTPTVLINGWRFSRPPSSDELDEAIERILAGDDPK